jgi:hypothetical protein
MKKNVQGIYFCGHCEKIHHVLETLKLECLIAIMPTAKKLLEAFEEEHKEQL